MPRPERAGLLRAASRSALASFAPVGLLVGVLCPVDLLFIRLICKGNRPRLDSLPEPAFVGIRHQHTDIGLLVHLAPLLWHLSAKPPFIISVFTPRNPQQGLSH